MKGGQTSLIMRGTSGRSDGNGGGDAEEDTSAASGKLIAHSLRMG
jgi:hypothetical protein